MNVKILNLLVASFFVGAVDYSFADYDNPNSSKEAAIKRSGAYRQEFDRRMSGTTGFENTAAGLQKLSSFLNGAPGALGVVYGQSIEEYMADSVIDSLESNKSIASWVTQKTPIIDIIDDYIDEAKKTDKNSFVFQDDIRQGNLWKAQFYLGLRDPGFVKENPKAAFKALNEALKWDRLRMADYNRAETAQNRKTYEDDQTSLSIKFYLALTHLTGAGTKKNTPEAVKYFSDIAQYVDLAKNSRSESFSLYSANEIFQSVCALTVIYAEGADGIEKNIEQVDTYSVKAADAYLLFSTYSSFKPQGTFWESAKPFVQVSIDEIRQAKK